MSPLLNRSAEMPPSDEGLFEQIASTIEQRGYCILPGALPLEISSALLDHLSHVEQERFHQAAIGRGLDEEQNRFVRRDKIAWIDEHSAHNQKWLNWTQQLQGYLNRRLFLGLFSFESLFAIYEPGDFYKTHLDAFRGESNRVLSLVTYLNKGWEPDHGGELVLYNEQDAEPLARVTPAFGTLVIFLSEEFPHEVLATQRERYSVAGWFRVNGSINDQIDPPR